MIEQPRYFSQAGELHQDALIQTSHIEVSALLKAYFSFVCQEAEEYCLLRQHVERLLPGDSDFCYDLVTNSLTNSHSGSE